MRLGLAMRAVAQCGAGLILSVALYVVIPLIAGIAMRTLLVRRGGEAAVARFTNAVKPFSILGLLATVSVAAVTMAGLLAGRLRSADRWANLATRSGGTAAATGGPAGCEA